MLRGRFLPPGCLSHQLRSLQPRRAASAFRRCCFLCWTMVVIARLGAGKAGALQMRLAQSRASCISGRARFTTVLSRHDNRWRWWVLTLRAQRMPGAVFDTCVNCRKLPTAFGTVSQTHKWEMEATCSLVAMALGISRSIVNGTCALAKGTHKIYPNDLLREMCRICQHIMNTRLVLSSENCPRKFADALCEFLNAGNDPPLLFSTYFNLYTCWVQGNKSVTG